MSGRLSAELRAFVAAVGLLTRVPLAPSVALDAQDVARAGPAFPVIGAGLGAAVGALAAALATRLSPLLAVGLALALGTALTGALHLDGLADAADALGARSREQALAIMREPTVGAFGATAIALDLLIKLGALVALVRDERVVRFALVAGALSRAAPVLLASALPYARSGAGTGDALTHGSRSRAALAMAIAAGIAVLAEGGDGAALVGMTVALTALLGIGLRRWLGGVTGDTLGVVVELTETAALVLAVALVGVR